ncbi:rRNA maturation RNase YbeY [Rhabdothermincola salaria]|uniref:rRNA maturation RNase YbeY n=1 Tax=Rhabdothermincola salaria TaxID=2903142 RepID=UPI001E6546E7|nr:rRNA maturation RNase YbeY [Rhabdothermincola salaria]
MSDRPPSRRRRRRGPEDGEVTVFVADEQARHPVDTVRWQRLAEQVLLDEGVEGECELSVLFVSHDTIASLNQRFMGHAGPTDVLSFPIDGEGNTPGRWPDGGAAGPDREDDPDDLPLLLGDVVICPEVAVANAPSHAGRDDDELALLVVHGILHLLGMDHADDVGREAMQARERELLAAHHGPLAADPWAALAAEASDAGDHEPAPVTDAPGPAGER